VAGNIPQMSQDRRADSIRGTAKERRHDRVEERPEKEWLQKPPCVGSGQHQMVWLLPPRVPEEEAGSEKKARHSKPADLIENLECPTHGWTILGLN
jgi:hypothetical protein